MLPTSLSYIYIEDVPTPHEKSYLKIFAGESWFAGWWSFSMVGQLSDVRSSISSQ